MAEVENPPAFPCTGEGYESPKYTQRGMTLRDWFAGQALAGRRMQYRTAQEAARGSYEIADAMLLSRKESSNV